jgi:hypothetical protein
MAVAEEAIADDRFDEAGMLADVARDLAQNARNTTRRKEAVALRQDIDQMHPQYIAFQAAAQVLAKTPSDPAAILAQAKYYCLAKGDWDRGLPVLAREGDAAVRALIEADKTTPPADPSQEAKRGDQWWDAAASLRQDVARLVRARAGYWYRKALPNLTGFTKIHCDRRIQELNSLGLGAHR